MRLSYLASLAAVWLGGVALCTIGPAVAQTALGTEAMNMCKVLSSGNMRDLENKTSAAYNFSLYRNALTSTNFESYDEYNEAMGKLGFDIPLADALLGIDAEAKSSSSSFQKKLSDFRNNTFSLNQAADSSRYDVSAISAVAARMIGNCVNIVRDIALGQQGLFVSAEPADRDLTVWLVRVSRRSGGGGPHIIRDVLPSDVKCTYEGRDIVLNRTELDEAEALLQCRKPNGRDWKNLTVSLTSTGAAQASARLLGLEEVMKAEADAREAELQARIRAAEEQAKAVGILAVQLAKAEEKIRLAEGRLQAAESDLRKKISNVTLVGQRDTGSWSKADQWTNCDGSKGHLMTGVRIGKHLDLQGLCMTLKLER